MDYKASYEKLLAKNSKLEHQKDFLLKKMGIEGYVDVTLSDSDTGAGIEK